MKKKLPGQISREEIVKKISRSDLIHIQVCLSKAYAMIYALHTIASDSSLQELGDDDALIILDEAVIQLQEVNNLMVEDTKKAA